MKILYLCPWPLKEVDFQESEYPKSEFGYYTMKRNGVDITPYTPEWSGWKGWLKKKSPHLFGPLFTQLGFLSRQKDYDLIYVAFDMHLLPLAIVKMVGICRKPIFVLSHFTYSQRYTQNKFKKIYKRIERKFVFQFIDKLSFANEVLLNIASNDSKVPTRHSNSAHWGTVLGFYNKSLYDVSPTENFYMAAGGMNRDYSTLIHAFKKIPDIELRVFAKYRDYTKDEDLPTNVHFIDLMDGNTYVSAHKALRDYYYDCKAILLPIDYINDVPNGATVLVEALAMGKPIIITSADTNYIDVEKEGCGMTVKPHDEDDWVRVLTYMEKHPDELHKMGQKSYELAMKKYNDKLFTDTILEQMEALVKSKIKS